MNPLKDGPPHEGRTAEKEEDVSDLPAGILIGFEDPESWWQELLLRDPRFRARVAQARGSLREVRRTWIEELREKYDVDEGAPPAEQGQCRAGPVV